MIQVQDSRFIYNWKKGEGGYPSYKTTKPEFLKLYEKFQQFAQEAGLGIIEENQWEVGYINHIPKGELWETPKEWRSIFPWLSFPTQDSLELDTILLRWSSLLGENRGRLHATLSYARLTVDGPESLILDLTARGTASTKTGERIVDGFEIGHNAIVRSFTALTSGSRTQLLEEESLMAIAETGLSHGLVPEAYFAISNIQQKKHSEKQKVSMTDPGRETDRKWNGIFNELQDWMRDPAALSNEDGQFPSRKTILFAWNIADRMAERGDVAPLAIVTDGSTGISLEWRSGPLSQWLEISPTGSIEEIVIYNGQMRSRHRFQI